MAPPFRHAICGVGAIEELALAGDRVAWISRMTDRQESFECLFATGVAGASTRTFGSVRCEGMAAVHVASGQCYQCPEGRGLAGLRGAGSLIAYNSMSYCFVTDPRSCNRGQREGSLVDGIWRLAGPRKQRVPQRGLGHASSTSRPTASSLFVARKRAFSGLMERRSPKSASRLQSTGPRSLERTSSHSKDFR
jgi:hypothetical protein